MDFLTYFREKYLFKQINILQEIKKKGTYQTKNEQILKLYSHNGFFYYGKHSNKVMISHSKYIKDNDI